MIGVPKALPSDDETAKLAEEWLSGATQEEISRRLGFAGNTVISMRFRRFVEKYLPSRQFGYAEGRKAAMREALEAYRSGRVVTTAQGAATAGVLLVGWQPIETAPKDGTEILAADRNNAMSLVAWASERIGFVDDDFEPGWYRRAEGGWDLFDGCAPQSVEPVMWLMIAMPSKNVRAIT